MMKVFLDNYFKIRLTILILMVASLPFYLFASSVLIILGAIIVVFVKTVSKKWSFNLPDFLSICCLAFYFLDIIGLTYTDSANMKVGLFFLEKHLAFLLAPLFFSDLEINSNSRRILLWTFISSCALAILICVVVNMQLSQREYGILFHPWIFSHDRFAAPIDMQAVYFSMYLGLCVLILVNFLMLNKRPEIVEQKSFQIFLLLFFIGILIQMGARTVIASVIAILILNLLYHTISKRSYKILLFTGMIPLTFALLILLNPVVKTRFADMFKKKYEESNYGGYFARSKIWAPGIELIQENFWAGVGTGDQQIELDKKYAKYNYTEAVGVLNMHNQYLQMVLGFGVVGLSVFLMMLILQFIRSLAARDFVYLSFLLLFSLSCLTESMLNRNKGIIFFLLFSFLFYKGSKSK